MTTVVVFGASGYVGGYVIEELARRGHDIVIVARAGAAGDPYRGLPGRIVTDGELARIDGDRTVVVNLAYPRSVPGVEVRAANERLIERVTRAVDATSAVRLVHASTQAVFGYEWKTMPRPGRAPLRLGDSYIESKRHAENALRRHWRQRSRAHDLVILRLGNVLGAGAAPWVSAMAQRILEGRASAGRGGQGALNGTYVRNIADYIAALVELEGAARPQTGGEFHHLAEFADRRWAELIEPMARTIGVRPRYRPDVPAAARTGALAYVRSAARRLAPVLARHPRLLAVSQRLRPTPTPSASAPAVEDPTWHVLTGGNLVLPAALLPGWTPPHSWESMLREIDEWLPAHGYTLRRD